MVCNNCDDNTCNGCNICNGYDTKLNINWCEMPSLPLWIWAVEPTSGVELQQQPADFASTGDLAVEPTSEVVLPQQPADVASGGD